MCGIAGILSYRSFDPVLIRRMARSLGHRGPDDDGCWIDKDAGIGLGHRRLAIVDLTEHGHQPMMSSDGRWFLTYNGEVYNHVELRRELERAGAVPKGGWRGTSDTETVLQSIAHRGVVATLQRLVGMFALAVWDRHERKLTLARDRFGEKPLYYGWVGRDFVFASELKAMRTHPHFDNSIDRRAVETLVARTYIPAPLSIYEGIFKLPPGTALEVDLDATKHPRDTAPEENVLGGGIRLERYWSYAGIVAAGLTKPIGDEDEAIESLEAALVDAVKGQAIADVPIGAFLSGGIDSSTIVALYQEHSRVPVRSFTIGFHEAAFNEAHHARLVAQHLGTEHHEQYVSAQDAMEVIPLLPEIYDEPFADSSQIPTFLLSRFARDSVTVALTGDGGDELLGGYTRYIEAERAWNVMKRVPRSARAAMASALGALPASCWSSAASMAGIAQPHRFASKMRKVLRVSGSARSFLDVYGSTLHQWAFEPAPTGSSDLMGAPLDYGGPWPDAARAMYGDAVAYLPDDILCKVDRASMAVSLETRVPFLDHRVAEVAARIPMSSKIRGRSGKAILRRLLGRHVPARLFERPKAGFGLPIGEWIKGPLRDWAEELLDRKAIMESPWLDAHIVQQRWGDHVAGRRDSTEAIWAILMFQAWLKNSASTPECAQPEPQRNCA